LGVVAFHVALPCELRGFLSFAGQEGEVSDFGAGWCTVDEVLKVDGEGVDVTALVILGGGDDLDKLEGVSREFG
jgi:hypothetical protein